MGDFAFIIHPIELDDVFRKLKFMRSWPVPVVETVVKALPPFKVSEITGVQSDYAQTSGHFVSCPLTSKQMVELPEDKVINKIIRAGKVAEKLGAKIVGLGAMTSVVGDAGITVAKNLDIAVTTGNSYTVATALQGTKKAAELMGIDLANAEVLVMGATGSIGSVCARILARDARFLTLLARDKNKLDLLSARIMRETGLATKVSSDVKRSVQRADIIIAVTGSAEAVIDVMDLKPGAIVCDVARPRDVSKRAAELRDDVLVIEGGVVDVPGDVDFGFNFGFPPRTSYACMAETMILSLEGKYESFTLGRDLSVAQVDDISRLAEKHGFKISGFRSFERAISPETIENIRKNAQRNTQKLSQS
ncbi:shikimate 5-dehydrogenase [Dethiobacter alkaliphilus]|uniref:Shikimate/quinate 5-dehydrogenase n=1 Tax=Dethiobacter alkaliphilus AHT 1 TaxID=555088 RepID=C0GJR4_DETAL|nr:shikimate 5-dehydrogenase [Dethiobacter alkaliphilus]EEG76421.1 Shikimate/quinate 5-dehydrogenase [Dethiobacter alkaliphilus AHT 1]